MTWRLICLQNRPVLVVSLLIGGLGVLVAFNSCQLAKRQTLTGRQNVQQALLVMPDDVQTNGNLVTMTGINQPGHRHEVVTYRVKTEAELNRIKELTRPTLWRVSGTLQPLLPATNDEQFDTRFYYRQRHIYNELRVSQFQSITTQPVSGLRQSCHVFRQLLSSYFKQMPAPLAGYCQQLIIGDNHVNNQELATAVKRLGIIHLFCISGMHVILLASLARVVGTYLWIERETIDGLLLVLLPLYLIIGGGSTSLVRAVIMTEVTLCQRLLRVDALDAWGVSLIVGLLWNPYLLFNLGGQLSYLLSLVLQVLTSSNELKRCWWLSLLSLPAILYRVYEFHLLSLVASYVMIPVFSLVIFPLVLVSAVTYGCLPIVGELVNMVLITYQRFLVLVSHLPGEVHFGKPAVYWAFAIFFMTAWLVEQASWQKYCYLLLMYLACFLLIHFPIHGEVVFVDIGQGDSIIIRTPFNRRVIMIDTGGKLVFSQPRWAQMLSKSDQAARTSINYLRSRGIHRVDTIYLSHHDADHIGYLPTLLNEMRVSKVVVPAGMEGQAALQRKLSAGQFHGQVIGATDHTAVDHELQVVHPFIPGAGKNEDSLVLAGEFGGHRFLFTGDLDRQNELSVIAKYPQLRADVLKLGHHGSRTASDPRFIRQLGVKRGIVSAGRFNRYHHPSDEVVAELKAAGVAVLSTQQYGMIKYQYYGNRGRWSTTLKGDEIRWTLPNSLNN